MRSGVPEEGSEAPCWSRRWQRSWAGSTGWRSGWGPSWRRSGRRGPWRSTAPRGSCWWAPPAPIRAGRLSGPRSRRSGSASPRASTGWASATPLPPPVLDADPALLDALALPRVSVLTVGAITTDSALVASFARDWAVEHLEAYAVAWACREAGVPFVAVLGIANVVGPDAHAQWLANRAAAEQAARAAAAALS
ncbi:MAG: hypothetical protein R2724_34960 [Bryobacterales bacterium]